MRWLCALTFSVATVLTTLSMIAHGEELSDARHKARQRAAEILRNALQAASPTTTTQSNPIGPYQRAVAEAVQVIGADSVAAAELTRALREAESPSPDPLRRLREQIESICEDLAFVPIMEADMPHGFPAPTPVGEMEVKRYPVYRMAQTAADARPAFWTLFNHIKRHNIAMTAPVEMTYPTGEAANTVQKSMAFLYASQDLGNTGSDGAVQVVDVRPQTVVSIGVRGKRSEQKIASAREELAQWLESHTAKWRHDGAMRILGYNSPFVAPSRQYFEVQIPIVAVDGGGEEASARAH